MSAAGTNGATLPATTLGAALARHGGIGPGFDAIRLTLAVAILCWHAVLTSHGREAEAVVWASPLSAPLMALMPMFFALSGFLVMGSFERSRDLRIFLGLRALRIVPALATEILISALLLGPLLTTVPLSAYFSDPAFLKYFGSLVGKVSYVLPGVFVHNPDPGRVNVSLWTIAPELSCYVYLGLQLALRLRRNGVTAAAVLLICANVAADLTAPMAPEDNVVLARYLVVAFALGNLLYLWRDRVPCRWGPCLTAAAVGLAAVKQPALIYLALACFAYVVVVVGCHRIPVPYPFSTGDYSYGIYLYAFPIQQMFVQFLPSYRAVHWNILVCLPIVSAVAFASWWFVERPALRGKGLLARLRPQPAEPNFARMAVPTISLAVYGALLSISSGFVPSSVAGLLIPSAAVAGAVATALRLAYLRRPGALGAVREPAPLTGAGG
jgi:peptidoglycan/LPS O-acetylase OafA/YrhL